MGLNGKPIIPGHGFLQVFDLAILEFHNFPTSCTNQMVMMAFVGHIVELGLGSEMTFLRQVGVAKEFEGPIDRGETDVRVFFGQDVI